MHVREALETVQKYVDAKAESSVYAEAARTYLNAVFKTTIAFGEHGLKVQIENLLENLRFWRGEEAREAKKVLKEFVRTLL